METALSKRINDLHSQRLIWFSPDHNAQSPTADFSSNDYLSFTKDARLREHFLYKLSLELNVMGATGSRLLDGNTPGHRALEPRLASFYRAESALVLGSGY